MQELESLNKQIQNPELWAKNDKTDNKTNKITQNNSPYRPNIHKLSPEKILQQHASLMNKIAPVKKAEENLKNIESVLKNWEEHIITNHSTQKSTEKNEETIIINEILTELLQTLKHDINDLEKAKLTLMFSGEADSKHCFLEIHSGAGGTESDDWAAMLLRMYKRWSEKQKYQITIMNIMNGDEAGIKSATIKLEGENAYGLLKNESGIHRLVRISPFSSTGKRHTSFASVWTYPVVDDSIKIEIIDSELKIDTYRASGAGGQHVNTTDSAVRITHLPTGIVVQSQNDRSQHKNKNDCMKMLKARLYEFELQQKEAKLNQENQTKAEIGWGNQIRSYVMQPYQMVKDLRTGYEVGNIQEVLDGNIDGFIKAALEKNTK